MVLAELAMLAGAEPKWVLNAAASLRVPVRYTLAFAQRLAIARELHMATGMPMPRAWELAGRALQHRPVQGKPFGVADTRDGLVSVEVDVWRILAAVNVRCAQLATMGAGRQRGPRPKRRDPVRAAERHGLDPSLLRANLARTPAERLRQLDAMVAFRRRVRRVAEP